jgi:hypothetical protein
MREFEPLVSIRFQRQKSHKDNENLSNLFYNLIFHTIWDKYSKKIPKNSQTQADISLPGMASSDKKRG